MNWYQTVFFFLYPTYFTQHNALQVYPCCCKWHKFILFCSWVVFHASEKEMATHSSVLAWRIPGTEEPGGLPSMGSHRVRHDWSDLAAAAVFHYMCVCVCVCVCVCTYIGDSQMAQWVKSSPASTGDAGSIPESGRSLERGHSNLLQCSCLENPMDRGAW